MPASLGNNYLNFHVFHHFILHVPLFLVGLLVVVIFLTPRMYSFGKLVTEVDEINNYDGTHLHTSKWVDFKYISFRHIYSGVR